MGISKHIQPVSYVKAHLQRLTRQVNRERKPILISEDGVAKAVLLDIKSYKSYEKSEQTLALLRILAIGDKEIREGKTYPLEEVIADLRARCKGGSRRSRGRSRTGG